MEERKEGWLEYTDFGFSPYPVEPIEEKLAYTQYFKDKEEYKIFLGKMFKGRDLYQSYLHEAGHIVLGSFKAPWESVIKDEIDKNLCNIIEDARIDSLISSLYLGYKMVIKKNLDWLKEQLLKDRVLDKNKRLEMEIYLLHYAVRFGVRKDYIQKYFKILDERAIDFVYNSNFKKKSLSNYGAVDYSKQAIPFFKQYYELDDNAGNKNGKEEDENGQEEEDKESGGNKGSNNSDSGNNNKKSEVQNGNNEENGSKENNEGNSDIGDESEDKSVEEQFEEMRSVDEVGKVEDDNKDWVGFDKESIKDLYSLSPSQFAKLHVRNMKKYDEGIDKEIERIFRRIRSKIDFEEVRNRSSGRIDRRKIYKVYVGKKAKYDYRDIFKREELNNNVAVILLLDYSGSMSGSSIEVVKQLLVGFRRIKEKHIIIFDSGIKYIGNRIEDAVGIYALGGTDFNIPIEFGYRKYLEYKKKGYKVITIMITDGHSSISNETAEKIRKMNFIWIGIGFSSMKFNWIKHTIQVEGAWELRDKFLKEFEERVYEVFKGGD